MAHSNLILDLRSYSGETRGHHHDFHQLVLPVEGRLSMDIAGSEGDVSESDIALIAAGKNHQFSGSEHNCFIVADVPAALAPELEKLPPFIALDAALAQYVRFLHQQLAQPGSSGSSERQMLLLLVELLKERYGQNLRLDKRIETLRDYLDANFRQPLSQARLAAVASLSSRQMNEVFRRELGMTPQQYLLEKRMQHAWQLLSNGNLQVQQVAEQSGYASLAGFSDRFRRHFGVSPRHFRRINE
jgi:AraC-like DNA-binding protein